MGQPLKLRYVWLHAVSVCHVDKMQRLGISYPHGTCPDHVCACARARARARVCVYVCVCVCVCVYIFWVHTCTTLGQQYIRLHVSPHLVVHNYVFNFNCSKEKKKRCSKEKRNKEKAQVAVTVTLRSIKETASLA